MNLKTIDDAAILTAAVVSNVRRVDDYVVTFLAMGFDANRRGLTVQVTMTRDELLQVVRDSGVGGSIEAPFRRAGQ